MKYYAECGAQLVEVKAASSWERRMKCDKCRVIYRTTFGDHMGGSHDVTDKINCEE